MTLSEMGKKVDIKSRNYWEEKSNKFDQIMFLNYRKNMVKWKMIS